MEANIKAFKNFYFFVGLSWKKFSVNGNVQKNLLAVWSSVMNAVLIILVFISAYSQLGFMHVCWEATIRMFVRAFTAFMSCLILLWSPLKRNQEEAFWEILKSFGKVEPNQLKIFIRITAFKATMMIMSLVILFSLLFVAFLLNSHDIYAKLGIYMFVNIAVCKLFRFKFIFFLDVFNFYLTQIKSCCGRDVIQKDLKRSIDICWKLIGILEDIFGIPILLNWVALFNVTILNFFYIYIAIDKGFLSFSPVLSSSISVLEIIFIANACQNCMTNVSIIKSKLFGKYSKLFRVEALILKLHHQNMIFNTNHMIGVDRKFIISVSAYSYFTSRNF